MNILFIKWSMKMIVICYIRFTLIVWMGMIKMVRMLMINMREIILLRLTHMMARYDVWLWNWWRWIVYLFIVLYLFYYRDYLVLNYFFCKRVLYLFRIFSRSLFLLWQNQNQNLKSINLCNKLKSIIWHEFHYQTNQVFLDTCSNIILSKVLEILSSHIFYKFSDNKLIL